MAWNDTTFNIANGSGLSAGGGGAAICFRSPAGRQESWEFRRRRFSQDVPDVSIDASPDHDGSLLHAGRGRIRPQREVIARSRTNGFRISDPGYQDDGTIEYIVSGTSFSAPSFAGNCDDRAEAGHRTGQHNPERYALASSSTTYAFAFHDITVGNNDAPMDFGFAGLPDEWEHWSSGYSAGTGYDQATGLGSIRRQQAGTIRSRRESPRRDGHNGDLLPAAPEPEFPLTRPLRLRPTAGPRRQLAR